METKQKHEYITGLKNSLGYDEVVTVEPIGLSGGLAVLWKSNFKVVVLSADKRVIDLKVALGSLTFYLSCVYGDPVRAMRHLVWDSLSNIGTNRDEAWVLLSDFNELMNHNEKQGGQTRHESSFWDFQNLADNCKIR